MKGGNGAVATVLIENVGAVVSGRAGAAPTRGTTLLIEDGLVAGLGVDAADPDTVIDAHGLTAIPGLVDGHVHPTFGEWTPAQDAIGWVGNYLHGGTTSMISAGELHVPGLPLGELDPRLAVRLAVVARQTTGALRPSGVKTEFGTMLLVPGMRESDFDELAEAGVRQLKFIFYDWGSAEPGEAQQYVRWAHDRGMVVKIHSGGVSRSGSSRIAGHDVVCAVAPDVVGHISGGPIPMPDEEIRAVIDDVPEAAIEVCSSMNYRATAEVVKHLQARDQTSRLVLGTDTPGGTGVIPRGMLRNICFLASMCGLDAGEAVAAATANTAAAHGLQTGRIEPGMPADLVLLGPIHGSRADDALGSFALGDLPGISMVFVQGEPLVDGRSAQTPPPRRPATMRRTVR
jgi:enamidase